MKKLKLNRRRQHNRPTLKMLLSDLSQVKDPIKKRMIEKKIANVKAWRKAQPETATYYPDRKKL
jgi:hypothetical protein